MRPFSPSLHFGTDGNEASQIDGENSFFAVSVEDVEEGLEFDGEDDEGVLSQLIFLV